MKNNITLTEEEKKAITALKRVAKIWPKSLWLFAAEGSLCIMKKNKKGHRAIKLNEAYEGIDATYFSGFDPDYIIVSIDIENEGGSGEKYHNSYKRRAKSN